MAKPPPASPPSFPSPEEIKTLFTQGFTGVVEAFAAEVPRLYTPEDRERGHIRGKSRDGVARDFPLITLSIGILDCLFATPVTVEQRSHRVAEVKKFAKSQSGNSVAVASRKARVTASILREPPCVRNGWLVQWLGVPVAPYPMVEDDKIFELFAESCLEQLRGIEAAILDLESAGPEALGPKVAAVFRAAHTIKGDAGAVGAAPLAELSHCVESVLDAVRQGRLPVTSRLIGELLSVFDVIKTMVEDQAAARGRDVAPEMARMAALLTNETPPAPTTAQPPHPGGETVADNTAASGERIHKLSIDARELDILVDRVGELGIAQARLAALSMHRQDEELRDVAEEVERLAALLRNQVLGLRLLPIKISFPKYRRLVRDTCAALGKYAQLLMEGENTELDKAVIEQLNTPCIHLLRNAIDHGIEPPQTRVALGKPERGTIRLSAHQDGNDVVIAVSDDGAGIDAAKLWRKAVAAGRIDPGRAFDPEAALELIFLPGLSTADSVGTVSGRGVGMDAVREGIAALRGRIDVTSTLGKGSVFTIRLPVSLAIIDCLEVRLDAETYYLHLDYVEECLELPPSVTLHLGRGVMDLRGEALPLVCLRHFFGLPPTGKTVPHVVTVRRNGGRAGLVVDGVVGRKQAVLKHLGRALGKVAGVLGATVTEGGDMALVVDVPGLLRTALAESQAKTTMPSSHRLPDTAKPLPDRRTAMPRALIVDDSRYQRYLIIQALGDRFIAEEAANGSEALVLFTTALQKGEAYDLVVMDILMPVLSGHDALAGIRRQEEAAGISVDKRTPAVMLSSLDDPGNMLRAQFESGAQAYVTKPFTAQTLLEALANLGLVENPLDDETPEPGQVPCKPF